MQGVIRNMLVEGKTPEEIEAYFLEAYGPWILLKPKAEGLNLLVYLLPVAAFLLGGVLFLSRIRRSRGPDRVTATEPPPSPSQSPAASLAEEDRNWIEAAIRGS